MPEIKPKNISAQLEYHGRGNPPGAHPSSSIANCFPGLEFDFRNIWKKLLAGIELHESEIIVVNVEPGSEAEQQGVAVGNILTMIDAFSTVGEVRGPRTVGAPDELFTATGLEWTNAVSEVLSKAGQKVRCRFVTTSGEIEAELEVNKLFDGAVITENAAAPGVLTQGLCSPWQADYLECGCYYWAASRPDFVNVEINDNQTQASGHNWLLKNRQPTTPKQYSEENLLTYTDLYRNWEEELKFIIEGRDET